MYEVLCFLPPQWNPAHNVRGVLYIPYAEIEEPFEAWIDQTQNRSRIDYYGGTVKTYQLSRSSMYGTSFYVAPVTTVEELNKITCLQVNGTEYRQIRYQPILPDCGEFQLRDSEELLGWECDKFVFEETIDGKSQKYTIWVRYVDIAGNHPTSKAIPVRFEVIGWDNLIGAHYDYYYLDYHNYSISDLPDAIFEVDEGKPCVGFPGPGVEHYAIFNPMKEFIHPVDSSHVYLEHNRFMNKHGVVYTSTDERMARQNVFMQNLRYINSKNREHLGFSLTVNALADQTTDEIEALQGRKSTAGVYNGGKPFPYELDEETVAGLPDHLDWRLFGAVTPVKDQAVCGSCWSFGTTGTIEGALFLHNGGNLIRLSEQALIDCSWAYGNDGCNGGQDFRAYEWIMHNGGIPTEESYGGYKGQDGFCHVKNANVTLVAKITGWVNVTSGNANALKVALLKHGPISVAIDASHKSFHFYSNGIYFEPKCGNRDDQLTHYVLVVGYGHINGKDYWLVKNSFSNLWGNDGYILMSTKENNCGILTDATYVLL